MRRDQVGTGIISIGIVFIVALIHASIATGQPASWSISGIDPESGSPGLIVHINGSNLPQDAIVFFGTEQITRFTTPALTRVSSSQLRFQVPVDECGEYDVFVGSSSEPGIVSNAISFEVTESCFFGRSPQADWSIANIDPTSGPPGLIAHIHGDNFPLNSIIFFGTEQITRFTTPALTRVSASTLRFPIPTDACGEYEVFVGNSAQPGVVSNTVSFEVVDCQNGDGPPENGGALHSFEVIDLDLPSRVEAGVQFNGNYTLEDTGIGYTTGDSTEANVELLINGEVRGRRTVELPPGQPRTFPLTMAFSNPGNYLVEIRTEHDSLSKTITAQASQTPSPPEDPTPPPTGGLSDLDSNGNCVLDTTEFLQAIDGWINGSLSNDLFFSAIDAWIEESNVCASSAAVASPGVPSVKAQVVSGGGSLQFSANRSMIAGMRVSVFDINGRPVFAGETNGPQLAWPLSTADGRPLPNGVYLYVATVRDLTGHWTTLPVRKVLMLR